MLPSVTIYGAGVDLAHYWSACGGPTISLKHLEDSVVQAPSLEAALVHTEVSARGTAAAQAAAGVPQPELGQPASLEKWELVIKRYHCI